MQLWDVGAVRGMDGVLVRGEDRVRGLGGEVAGWVGGEWQVALGPRGLVSSGGRIGSIAVSTPISALNNISSNGPYAERC
jgi:hypothetical protein